MKKSIKYIVAFALLSSVIAGCYKDKGNYDYEELKQLSITANTPDTVSILLQDTLRINITLAQSMPSSGGYEFAWTLYQNIQAPLSRWALGTSKNLNAQITQPPGQYLLDYFVTDKETGLSYRKLFVINIISEFNEGWMVLEEKGSGCDLALITPIDSIFKNIYSSANKGSQLPVASHTLKVMRDRRGQQKIYVVSPNELTEMYFADFLKVSAFDDYFWGTPAVKKPQEIFSNSSNDVIINNGYPHGNSTITPPPNKYSLAAPGTWDVEPYEIYNITPRYIFYDKLSQAFYKYDLTDMLRFSNPPATAVFNVNKVGKKMLYAGKNTGTFYDCVFKNNSNDSLFVYRLNAAIAQPAVDTAYISNNNAPGMVTASHFLSSRLLPHMYYISENKVYLLDIPARKARLVYSFPPAARATSIELYFNSSQASDPDNNRMIGISTLEAGVGTVYTFAIGTTGDFIGNTYRKRYTGFGKINDIAFKPTP